MFWTHRTGSYTLLAMIVMKELFHLGITGDLSTWFEELVWSEIRITNGVIHFQCCGDIVLVTERPFHVETSATDWLE